MIKYFIIWFNGIKKGILKMNAIFNKRIKMWFCFYYKDRAFGSIC